MPAYRDGKKWRAVFYYSLNGKRMQKCKRNFSTKKEAQEWEREFLRESNFSMDMKLNNFYEIYMKDIEPRITATTYVLKQNIFTVWILPFFGETKVSAITPIMVRTFQNGLLTGGNPKTGKNYKAHYIQKVNAQLSAILNHAVQFYNLKENPYKRAGPLKLRYEKKMNIWTLDEFNCFAEAIKHKPISYAAFNTLFWTGMRVGELLALTREDVDLRKKTITINKSYTRLKGEDIIKSTKNESSERIITIPDSLVKILQSYFSKLYDLSPEDRIFNITREVFKNDLTRYHKKAGVKKISPHDLRHSHASLLINNNVNPLAISKRLGHAKVDMTLNTYSHLYPSSEEKMLEILNKY